MKQVLQKIEWKTRKWKLDIEVFNIYFPSEFRCWGLKLFKIRYRDKDFSLLTLLWRFPNVTEGIKVRFFWDLFFMHNYLDEPKFWNPNIQIIKQVLHKIEWKTRKWKLHIDVFNIYFPAESRWWGLELFKIRYRHEYFSLLTLLWRFPNGEERIQVEFSWDLFFMYNYLTERAIAKAEAKFWNPKK